MTAPLSRFTYPRSFTNDVADTLASWRASLEADQIPRYDRLCCMFADLFAEHEPSFDEEPFLQRARCFYHQ